MFSFSLKFIELLLCLFLGCNEKEVGSRCLRWFE